MKKKSIDYNNIPIGTIIASMLPPEKLEKQYGRIWVLADGSRVSQSTSYVKITGKSVLPDLRGVFIRGLNLGRQDGKEDPNGANRKSGDYQPDDFKSHTHQERPAGSGQWFELYKRQGSWGNERDGNILGPQTGPKGGSETRPKIIAVYYYIKVN